MSCCSMHCLADCLRAAACVGLLSSCTVGAKVARPGQALQQSDAGTSDAGMVFRDASADVTASPPKDDAGEDAGVDAALDAGVPDAAVQSDADASWGDADSDGDGLSDAQEAGDGDPGTDPLRFNGLLATIGERPELTGSCGFMDDYAEMSDVFDPPVQQAQVRAGWDFETDADSYDDPSYGFDPAWPEAESGRFSLRFSGVFVVRESGRHCFAIDIGADGGTGLLDKNSCGQLYLGGGDGVDETLEWFAEAGFAADAGADQRCEDLDAGEVSIDIVLRYFDVNETNRLHVRHCYGGATDCDPDQPIVAADVHPRTP